jgi:glycogen(starch) synthase
MRLGFFVSEYPPRVTSGLGTYAEQICQAMKRHGHDITVFTMNDGTLKTRENVNGVDVNRPLLVNGSTILPELITMKKLLRLSTSDKFFNDVLIYNILSASKFVNEFIRKERESFDIICAHNWQSAIAGIIIKEEERSLPFVFHLHSIEENRSAVKGTTIIRHIEETAAHAADRIVTVCYPLHEYLMLHGFEKTKINVCWNAVNVEKYDPDKITRDASAELRGIYGIEQDEKMLLFVGDLTLTANIVNLVHAMHIVANTRPEAKLVILGKGESERSISNLIAEWGLQDNVKTRFEFVTEEERIVHYGASDMIVCPSLSGPCSLISLEAMAMKKPVIVGSKGICCTCDHVIPSGSDQTGFLTDGSNPTELAWDIVRLLDDEEGAKAMGERGRRRLVSYRTWDEIAAHTLKLYEDVIEEVGSGGNNLRFF